MGGSLEPEVIAAMAARDADIAAGVHHQPPTPDAMLSAKLARMRDELARMNAAALIYRDALQRIVEHGDLWAKGAAAGALEHAETLTQEQHR